MSSHTSTVAVLVLAVFCGIATVPLFSIANGVTKRTDHPSLLPHIIGPVPGDSGGDGPMLVLTLAQLPLETTLYCFGISTVGDGITSCIDVADPHRPATAHVSTLDPIPSKACKDWCMQKVGYKTNMTHFESKGWSCYKTFEFVSGKASGPWHFCGKSEFDISKVTMDWIFREKLARETTLQAALM